MRILRAKHNRKWLQFYNLHFGIRPRYKLLLDGNFLYMAEQMKIEIFRFLRNLLQTHLYTGLVTPCILKELELLNKKHNGQFKGALRLARKFKLRECSCEKPQAASDCIASLLGTENSEKFFVATQDRELKGKARNIPGTPIIVFSNNVLVMESPSTVSKQFVSQRENAKLAVPSADMKLVKTTLKKQEEELKAKLPISGAPVDFHALALEEAKEDITQLKKKKKKKPQAPNPLSVKKKQFKPDVTAIEAKTKPKKVRRKRKRVGGEGDEKRQKVET